MLSDGGKKRIEFVGGPMILQGTCDVIVIAVLVIPTAQTDCLLDLVCGFLAQLVPVPSSVDWRFAVFTLL